MSKAVNLGTLADDISVSNGSISVNNVSDMSANFFLSDTSINTDYIIPNGKNVMIAGPVTINATVSIPSGSGFTVV